MHVLSEDFVELESEHNEIPSRSNRDKIINTNGRCLLDLCKTTEMSIVNGRSGSDIGIGDFTCITHNGKSLEYFIKDSSSLNLIEDITVWNFDECLSNVHCPVLIELAGSMETPPDDSVMVSKLKRKWNREVQELYTSEINSKELIEIENSLQEEPCSLETLNVVNARIVQVIKDSATKAGALHEVKNSEKKTNLWFNRECQEQRTIYRRIRRKALREINDEERMSGFKIYRRFLTRKKLLASERFNTELQTKKIENPKEYWILLKSFNQDHGKIPIAKSVLFDHFKTQQCHEPSQQ